MWIRRHPVRTVIYVAILAGIGLLAFRGGAVAGWIATGPAGRSIARFLGVGWRAAEARLTGAAAELSGIYAEVDGEPPVRFTAKRVHIDGLRRFRAAGIAIGDTLVVDRADIDVTPRAATITGVRFARMLTVAQARAGFTLAWFEARSIEGFGMEIGEASASAVRLEQNDIRVDTAKARGIRVTAVRDASGRWNVEEAAALAPAVQQLVREGVTLSSAYNRVTSRARSLVLWAIVVVAAVVAAAKFLLTHGSAAVRAGSAAVPVLVPLLAQSFGMYVSWGAIAVAAALLFLAVYRTAPEWHQRAEPLAIDLTGPGLLTVLLAAYFFTYPALPAVPGAVRLDQAGMSDVTVSIRNGGNDITVSVPRIALTGVTAASTTQVRRVTATDMTVSGRGWQVALPQVSALDVNASQQGGAVERIEFRGDAVADVARAVLARYAYLPDVFRRPVAVAFEGSGQASGPPLRFGAESEFRGQGAHVQLRADGNAEAVTVTRIRTPRSSALQIADGRAHVPLARGGTSTVHLSRVSLRPFAAGAVDVSAGPGHARAHIEALEFPNAGIASVLADATFSGTRLSVDTSIRDIVFRSQDGAISGDVPALETRLSGHWSSDVLNGEFLLRSSRFALDRPLRFSADLRAGAVRAPDQPLALIQTALRRAPKRINAEIAFTANLHRDGPAADLRLGIPRLELDVQPLGLELNGLEISAALASRSPRVAIETGWNRIHYPAFPQPNRLEAIDRFQIALRLKGDLLNPALFEASRVPELPALPQRFRVAGVWPDLGLITDRRDRFSLSGLSARLKSLAVPQSRVHTLGFGLGLGEIEGLRADLRSEVSLTDDLTVINAAGSFAGAPSFDVTASPGALELSIPHLRPGAGGFHGGISGIRAAVTYSPGRIETATGSLTLDAGTEAGVSLDPGPVTAARARLDQPARIAFSATHAYAEAEVSAPDLMLSAETRTAGNVSVEGSLDASVRAVRASGPAPILDALTRYRNLAAPHVRRVRELYGGVAGNDWKVVATRTADHPFLRIGENRMALRGAFRAGPFRTGGVAADLVERDGTLFVDASVPVVIEGRESPLVIPLLVCVRELFPEPDPKRLLLWEPGLIEGVWAGYTPRNAVGGAIVDLASVELGPISLLQVTVPSEPVQVVVGLGDRIQIHAPVAARLLFGSVTAIAQAELASEGRITARVRGKFRDVQTASFGFASNPIVEDSLDGSFHLAVHDLAITREELERWRLRPASFDRYDRVDFSLEAARTENQAGPATLQLGFDTRLRVLNEIIQIATDRLRFQVPPQLITYRGLRASLKAASGIVQTERPILELSNVNLFSSDLLDINGNILVRLGDRHAHGMPVSDLVRSVLGGVR